MALVIKAVITGSLAPFESAALFFIGNLPDSHSRGNRADVKQTQSIPVCIPEHNANTGTQEQLLLIKSSLLDDTI